MSVGSTGARGRCTFTETVTIGAASTSWTCAYTFTPVSVPEGAEIAQAGCEAAAGSGTGPATVISPGNPEVSEQASTVVFTSTFVAAPPIRRAPQIIAQATFTG